MCVVLVSEPVLGDLGLVGPHTSRTANTHRERGREGNVIRRLVMMMMRWAVSQMCTGDSLDIKEPAVVAYLQNIMCVC